MSAMAEVSSISENPTSSMRHQALVFGGALTSLSRGAALEVEIRILVLLELLGVFLGFALVHGLI